MPILTITVGKTLSTLLRPGIWKFLVLSALLNLLVWSLLVSGIWGLLHSTSLSQVGWVEWMVDWLGVGLAVIIALLLFPFTFPAAVSVFCEMIANQVDRKEYPLQYQQKINAPLFPQLWDAAKFLLITLVLNTLLLPFYFIPVLNLLMFFLYYAVNGYLLGREFFSLVAVRYLPAKEVAALRKAHKYKLTALGAMLLMVSAVPVVNFFIPAIAVIGMVHIYHQLT